MESGRSSTARRASGRRWGKPASPRAAVYMGDIVEIDVVGARRAGLRPVLLDRYDACHGENGCVRVRSLEAVVELATGNVLHPAERGPSVSPGCVSG